MSGANGGKVMSPTPEGQLDLWGETLAVERERIASRNRMVDAMREGFANLDAADERQYQFQTERLRREDDYRNRRLTHRMRLTWVFALTGVAVIGVVLYMVFWGGEEQRNIATTLLLHALSGVAFLALGYIWGRRSRD